jgi:EmrB/QacA subfamily drug resistance transporter
VSQVVSSKTTQPVEKIERRQWLILLTLALGLAIVIIDSTIVNVAIPSIRKDFGATLQDLEWVNSIYSLIFAALIVTWGRVGDQIGRKRIFIAGVAVFVAGSLMAGVSSGITMLIVARALQGLGAAMTSPSTLSIISGIFTGRMRGVAFGIWGGVAGAAAALGPLVGGWLITNASWRWAFLINLPIGIIAIVGALRLISESRESNRKLTFDVPGILLIALGIGGVVFGLIEGQTHGWWAPTDVFTLAGLTWPLTSIAITPFSFALGFVALALFVVWETTMQKRGGEPLFDFALLRLRGFRFGLITVAIVALGEFGVIFVLSIYLQSVIGLSAFSTGLTFLPFALTTLVVAPMAGIFSARFGPKWVVTTGMAFEALAIFLISFVLSPDLSRLTLVLILVIYGAGVGLAIAQLTSVVLSEIPPQRLGVASGANNTIRQVGAALGIAVIGAVLTAQISAAAKVELQATDLLPPPVKAQIMLAVEKGSISDSQFSADPSGAPQANANSPMGKELTRIFQDSFISGARAAARTAALFVFLGALSSLFIPSVIDRRRLVAVEAG